MKHKRGMKLTVPVSAGRSGMSLIWRAALVLFTAGTVGALTGCAGLHARLAADAPAEKKAEHVRLRAKERWQALIARDIDQAYSYLSPASRQVATLAQYKAKINPTMYRSVEVDQVICEPEACAVRVLLTYDHAQMKGITTPVQESWVFEDGKFWYVYRG